MRRQQREDHEQRVKNALCEAERLLGIEGRYELSIIFEWGHDGDGQVDEDGATNVSLTTAVTNAQWQYMRARIRFHMPVIAASSDERLFAVVVHEIVHVLLNPLDSFTILSGDDPRANDASKANEYTTETVTRAILSAAGRPYPGRSWLDEV